MDCINIFLTGSTGFIGREILNFMRNKDNLNISLSLRNPPRSIISEPFVLMDFMENINWPKELEKIDVIIHTAALAHIINKNKAPLYKYRDINVAGTLNLARQAAMNGVKRFIFVSSIGVNGGQYQSKPFTHKDEPSPWDAYSQSKYEAEIGLWKISHETGMEIVIIRPPLVYGYNAPGNFGKLINAVKNGRWLPLGKIENKKSFVAIDNLVDLIVACIDHPNAANQTFLVSDDQDVSTTELLKKMANAFGQKPHLIPIPMSWIRGVASLLGKKAVADRLCGSLQVDITHTKETLGWVPPVTMGQQLAKIATSMSLPRDV